METDIPKLDMPFNGRKFSGIGSILDLNRRIHQSKNPFPSGHGRKHLIIAHAQAADQLEESGKRQDEGHQHTRTEGLLQYSSTSHPDNQGCCHDPQKVNGWEKTR